jgi:hypothetical protein
LQESLKDMGKCFLVCERRGHSCKRVVCFALVRFLGTKGACVAYFKMRIESLFFICLLALAIGAEEFDELDDPGAPLFTQEEQVEFKKP